MLGNIKTEDFPKDVSFSKYKGAHKYGKKSLDILDAIYTGVLLHIKYHASVHKYLSKTQKNTSFFKVFLKLTPSFKIRLEMLLQTPNYQLFNML